MITRPLNDWDCLDPMHEDVLRCVAHPVYLDFANKFDSKEEAAAFIRTRPFKLDRGDPDDGPRIACAPSQRLRHLPPDYNCFEGTSLYLTVAEIIDPSTPRTSCTIRVNEGYHTFPVENGRPVILDPDPPPRNAMHAGIYTCERRNGRPSIVDAGEARAWIVRVAANAAQTPAERAAVRTALRALNRSIYRGEPLTDLYAVATTIALAESEAALWGDDGFDAIAHGAHSVRNLLQRTEFGSYSGMARRIGERALEAYIVAQTGPVGLVLLEELKSSRTEAPAADGKDRKDAKDRKDDKEPPNKDDPAERPTRTADPLAAMSL